jgi:hypothetical protein
MVGVEQSQAGAIGLSYGGGAIRKPPSRTSSPLAKDDLARGRQHPSLGEHLKWGQLAARPTSPRGGGILKRWVRFVLTPQGFSSLLPPEGMSRQFSAQRPLKLAPTTREPVHSGTSNKILIIVTAVPQATEPMPCCPSAQAVGDRLVVAVRQMFKFPRLLKEYYLSQKI